jgi:glutamate-1-semialdehyde aminotransferase
VGGYHEYLTLFALNRGVVPNPCFNMLMTSPYHTKEDNERSIAMFDEYVANMLG